MMRVKICGITNLDDALGACDAGADALGFVFAEEAKARQRFIDPEAAQGIIEKLPPFVTTVAVTVNDSLERLRDYLTFLDQVQLCGEEPEELCAELGDKAIKALHASIDFDPAKELPRREAVYLLDAFLPGSHGGTGTTCNWRGAARAVELGHRIILAGGLTPENVAEAVRAVRPCAVDTSGGVESAPGKKDHERIRRFIQNARLSVSR